MVEIRDLTIRVSGRTILHRVSAAFQPGQFTALVGPHGAGKSTLLKAMTGDVAIHSGAVFLEGVDVRLWPARRMQSRVAVMSQTNSINLGMTAREVASLSRTPEPSGCKRSEGAMAVQKALELAGAAHMADRPYPALSAGDQQRVQVARTLAQVMGSRGPQPRYLWLDEPAAGLDAAHRQQLFQILKSFTRAGRCVLCVLHDLDLAGPCADQVLVLRDGRLESGNALDHRLRHDLARQACPFQEPPLPGLAGPERSGIE